MSKIDQKFAQDIRENINAVIAEVERLEGILERVGFALDPFYSGGDVEWLAKRVVENFHELEKKNTSKQPESKSKAEEIEEGDKVSWYAIEKGRSGHGIALSDCVDGKIIVEVHNLDGIDQALHYLVAFPVAMLTRISPPKTGGQEK